MVTNTQVHQMQKQIAMLKLDKERLLRQAAIEYGLSSIVMLSQDGDSKKNRLVPIEKQVEFAFVNMITYYYINHDCFDCDVCQNYVKRSYNSAIECDRVLRLNGVNIDFEVDGSTFHRDKEDSKRDIVVHKNHMHVIRIQCSRQSLKSFLKEKLPVVINAVDSLIHAQKYLTVRV
jgi:hypothetical protein